ncbi:MAG: Beta-glucanase [uncultured bacterium]|nr:MAG: Beta-glucanase [uncultured bacterium]
MSKLFKLIILCSFLAVSNLIFSAEEAKYDFGDSKSATLTAKAWEAFQAKDWNGVEAFTEKCIALYSKPALQMQSELTSMPNETVANKFWALNDVGTCYYVKAQSFKEQSKIDQAKKMCQLVMDEYSYAQCWDKQGWFWSVANACKDLMSTLGTNVDFEDYTSETLTRKAWEALDSGNTANALIYVNKCLSLYKKDALKQQESLTTYAPKDKAFDYWALNDVATCLYIKGDAYAKDKDWEKSVEAYKSIINEYFYAQCWDPRGWFWKPAVACRGKLNKIMAEQGIS